MLEIRNAYKILIRKCEGRRPLCRHRHRWEDNIKVNVRKIGFESMDWIDQVHGKVQSCSVTVFCEHMKILKSNIN
jgi:hypothetical protein